VGTSRPLRREVERAKKSKKAKRGTPAHKKKGDDEGDAGEEEKETGVKARARSGRSVSAARPKINRDLSLHQSFFSRSTEHPWNYVECSYRGRRQCVLCLITHSLDNRRSYQPLLRRLLQIPKILAWRQRPSRLQRVLDIWPLALDSNQNCACDICLSRQSVHQARSAWPQCPNNYQLRPQRIYGVVSIGSTKIMPTRHHTACSYLSRVRPTIELVERRQRYCPKTLPETQPASETGQTIFGVDQDAEHLRRRIAYSATITNQFGHGIDFSCPHCGARYAVNRVADCRQR
jgi:hypothetical protein